MGSLSRNISNYLIRQCSMLARRMEKQTPILLMISLCAMSIVFDVTILKYKPSLSGATLSLKIPELILMGMFCWCLHRAIIKGNWKLSVPWMTVNSFNLYFIDCKSFARIILAMWNLNGVYLLPCICLSLRFIGVIIRIFTLWNVTQLFRDIEYSKRLQETQ